MKIIMTKEQLEFLISLSPNMTHEELFKLINKR